MTETIISSKQLTEGHRSPSKTIVISGVTSGLGRALLAHYYLQGHNVSGCGTRVEVIDSLRALYPKARLSAVDVTNDAAVAAWANEIYGGRNFSSTSNHGNNHVDIVIANAGLSPETALENCAAWEVPRDDFDATIDVNIKGVANMIRHFIPRMIDEAKNQQSRQCKSFVAMSSGLGRSPNPFHSACCAHENMISCCASKWAVEGMIKSLAMSLPPTLCAVPLAPGVVQTGMMPGNGGDNTVSNWVKVAGPMILSLNREQNGKSLSVDGFYTEKYKDTWIINDGVGVPDQLGHDFVSSNAL